MVNPFQRRVLLVGAGELGSRHLQAFRAAKLPISISVCEPFEPSRRTAETRFHEVAAGAEHQIQFAASLSELEGPWDVAIVATNADARAEVVRAILDHSSARYMILEKLLFTQKSDYTEIPKRLAQADSAAWVNCPRRQVEFYQQLRERLAGQRFRMGFVGGNFGLMTSAIHFADLFAFLASSPTLRTTRVQLDPKPIPSKRRGFIELFGSLQWATENGSECRVEALTDPSQALQITLETDDATYAVDESRGSVLRTPRSGGSAETLPFRLPYQSTLTTWTVESLLLSQTCPLTPLDQSVNLHLGLLEPVREFLASTGQTFASDYPFT